MHQYIPQYKFSPCLHELPPPAQFILTSPIWDLYRFVLMLYSTYTYRKIDLPNVTCGCMFPEPKEQFKHLAPPMQLAISHANSTSSARRKASKIRLNSTLIDPKGVLWSLIAAVVHLLLKPIWITLGDIAIKACCTIERI